MEGKSSNGTLTLMGNPFSFKARGEDTCGQFSLIEYEVLPGTPSPPAHVHDGFDEAFYIIDGQLTLEVAGQARQLKRGDFIFVESGTPHTFSNPGAEPTRMMILISPGGYEGYYEELASVYPVPAPPNMPAILDIMGRYGVRMAAKPQA